MRNPNRLPNAREVAALLTDAFDRVRCVRWGLVSEIDRQLAVDAVRRAEAAANTLIAAQASEIAALRAELDNVRADAAAARAMRSERP